MNLPTIEVLIFLMFDFHSHPLCVTEIADLKRRFHHINEGVESFKKLCEVQFHPIAPRQIIAPGKLHRVTQNDIWALWKVELAIKGVRSNQSPRIWFVIRGSTVVFLCAKSHPDNYDDNEVNTCAVDRATDFF